LTHSVPAPPLEAPASIRHRPTPLPRGRLLLLAGGGLGLLLGVWTGLARAGVHDPFGPIMAHGVIMVLGFLGTLIALERAVALGARWGYAGPALSGAAVLVLFAGATTAGGILLTAAGVVVTAVYGVTLHRHYDTHLALMAVGALAWVLAAALWTVGLSPIRLFPLLAAFLVLTIVGERLELSRLRVPSAASRRRLVAASLAVAAGAVLTLVARTLGLTVAGIGLLLQTAWLLRNDIARVTIRRPGLPRFAAACLLAGFVWLGISGVLWILLAHGRGGALVYDAALHTLFLGFVMSMVMGHAPIILPAVLRTPLLHHPVAWGPLVILHASVAVRVGADLGGSTWLRGWSAHGNVTALLLFVAVAAWVTRRGRRHATLSVPVSQVVS
jgi:hypothetical protein